MLNCLTVYISMQAGIELATRRSGSSKLPTAAPRQSFSIPEAAADPAAPPPSLAQPCQAALAPHRRSTLPTQLLPAGMGGL